MGTCEFNAGGNPAMDWHPIQGGVEIFLVASCHGNRDKLRPDGPLGSYADFWILVLEFFCLLSLLCPTRYCNLASSVICKLTNIKRKFCCIRTPQNVNEY